ncbi:MAG TPA: DUF1844 domain-containing protein [Terriglobales bacterium]
MPDKKQESFTVTDRRLFNSNGELRDDLAEEEKEETKDKRDDTSAPPLAPAAVASVSAETTAPAPDIPPMPPSPTAAEQKESADAYSKSAKELDSRVELSGHSAKDLEMTFERFMASLYMSAMFQLGLMHEQGGQPRIDIIGARQTIDTLTLLQEKTRGNLTPAEQNFLQNCLYELRMAYVEVTSALSRPPVAPAGSVKP